MISSEYGFSGHSPQQQMSDDTLDEETLRYVVAPGLRQLQS